MPQSYQDVILRQFPNDERLGFFVKPQLPTNILGRVLNDHTKLGPGEVLAIHRAGGSMLGGGGTIVLTATHLYYDKGYFLLEDLKSAQASGKTISADVNQNGALVPHTLKADSDEAARILARTLDTLGTQPKASDVPTTDYAAQGFSAAAIPWLELRDEVLRTVDLLHARFQAGKLGLLEYEETKAALLRRLPGTEQ